MKQILVPTDFSDNALKAALYAAMIAKKTNAEILLLHSIEHVEHMIRQPFVLHDKFIEEMAKGRVCEMKVFRKKIVREFPGIKTKIKITEGSPSSRIIEYAEQQQPDLIIMGTKGATGLKEIFAGSTTSGIIGKTKCPVLAVPEDHKMGKIDAVLLATIHFEKNIAWLKPVVDIAALFCATIHVVVFIDPDTSEGADYAVNARQLNHYVDYLKNTFPTAVFKAELLDGKEFERTIEKYDSAHEVDIISMFTYTKSIWEKIQQKSFTKKIACHSKIPLLAITAR
jgi:nucleotide-binding universal stress UspA family protein